MVSLISMTESPARAFTGAGVRFGIVGWFWRSVAPSREDGVPCGRHGLQGWPAGSGGGLVGTAAGCFGIIGARGAPPAGFVSSKGGRLAVVVGTAAAAPGESDDGGGLPFADGEVKVCLQLLESDHK